MLRRPALRILGEKPEWKPVLRKLGQMLLLLSPDPSISEYEESYKICMNHSHFVNFYLFINKAGGGKKTSGQKRYSTQPKIQTSRALQRFSVLIMSGFLLNLFQQLPDNHAFAYLEACDTMKKCISAILHDEEGITNILYVLGYDIALRNWIKESTGKLVVYEKKPRAKKGLEQFRAKILQMEENMRNVEKHCQTQVDELHEQLRNAQNKIQDLQKRHDSMQVWFSMYKPLLEDLIHGGAEENNNETNDFAQTENGKGSDALSKDEGDEIEENNDADGQEDEDYAEEEKDSDNENFVQQSEDEEDHNHADGQENEHDDAELEDDLESGKIEAEEEDLQESDHEQELEESVNDSESE